MIVVTPVQVPLLTVMATPSLAVAERVGATVLSGGLGRMTALASEAACVAPPPFVAVTSTRTWVPAEPAGGVKVVAVAPAMSVQLLPPSADACHWYA